MIRRGDVVTVAAPGDYGKPRPALVIQGDIFNRAQPGSVILALITSTLREAPLLRLGVAPSAGNGLKKPSQIMMDKLQTVRIEKLGQTIGRLSEKQMLEFNRLLAVVVGLA